MTLGRLEEVCRCIGEMSVQEADGAAAGPEAGATASYADDGDVDVWLADLPADHTRAASSLDVSCTRRVHGRIVIGRPAWSALLVAALMVVTIPPTLAQPAYRQAQPGDTFDYKVTGQWRNEKRGLSASVDGTARVEFIANPLLRGTPPGVFTTWLRTMTVPLVAVGVPSGWTPYAATSGYYIFGDSDTDATIQFIARDGMPPEELDYHIAFPSGYFPAMPGQALSTELTAASQGRSHWVEVYKSSETVSTPVGRFVTYFMRRSFPAERVAAGAEGVRGRLVIIEKFAPVLGFAPHIRFSGDGTEGDWWQTWELTAYRLASAPH